jgi:hypothetical protein
LAEHQLVKGDVARGAEDDLLNGLCHGKHSATDGRETLSRPPIRHEIPSFSLTLSSELDARVTTQLLPWIEPSLAWSVEATIANNGRADHTRILASNEGVVRPHPDGQRDRLMAVEERLEVEDLAIAVPITQHEVALTKHAAPLCA